MEILFMVFMSVVSIMVLFAVMVVFRDIVKEILESRKKKETDASDIILRAERIIAEAEAREVEAAARAAAAAAEVKEEEKEEEPAPEEPAPEEPAAEEAPAEEDDGKISFSTGNTQTLEEKYLALTSEQKGWYDEIIKYAANVEGSKRYKNARYEEYKVGMNRLVRMLIKRGVINCEFILHNSDFKNYVNENKITVKQSATTMLIESAETVEAAKSSIDIVVAFIAEEKEYKKQLAREKRRAAREAAAAEAAAEEK